MGLYGNMLTHFAGQLRTFTYFDMTPNVNSGYTINPNVPVRTLRGILQNSASDVEDGNGNIIHKVNEFLWTSVTGLEVGKFVRFDVDTYRIVPSNDWAFEGGFTRYTLQRVVGDNGTPDTNTYTTGIGGTPV